MGGRHGRWHWGVDLPDWVLTLGLIPGAGSGHPWVHGAAPLRWAVFPVTVRTWALVLRVHRQVGGRPCCGQLALPPSPACGHGPWLWPSQGRVRERGTHFGKAATVA